jgi:hypothetical protein
LVKRRATNQRITVVLSSMVLVIIAATIVFKGYYYRKTVRLLKDKKIV